MLIGHAILWIFVSGGDVNFVARCLLIAKAHQPNVFLVRNNQGSTLLDIVIRDPERHLHYCRKRSEIVRLIVQEDPDTCLQRGRVMGDFPFTLLSGRGTNSCLII